MKLLSTALVATVALVVAGSAFAHVRISPPVALAKATQVFTIVAPTESETADTTEVEITIPEGFSVGAVVPNPDWKADIQSTGTGEDTVVQKITWSGGKAGPGEAAFLQFSGRSSGSETYAFPVKQTYSDGTVANWTGPESSDEPAPTVEAVSEIGGGGGTSLISWIALVLGVIGVMLGGVALASSGGKRPLA